MGSSRGKMSPPRAGNGAPGTPRQPLLRRGTPAGTPSLPRAHGGGWAAGPPALAGDGLQTGAGGSGAGGAWGRGARPGQGAAVTGPEGGLVVPPRCSQPDAARGPSHPAGVGGPARPPRPRMPLRYPLPAAGVPLLPSQPDGEDRAAAAGASLDPACGPSTAEPPPGGERARGGCRASACPDAGTPGRASTLARPRQGLRLVCVWCGWDPRG